MPQKPHILFMIADDHAARFLGQLTRSQAITPNLLRLARRGACFTTAMNMGSRHGAVCAPSRAMLHTGRSLWRTGGDETGDYPLLAQRFGDAGYATFAVGKWHNGADAAERSFADRCILEGGMMGHVSTDNDAYHRPAPGNTWDPADPTRPGHWLPPLDVELTPDLLDPTKPYTGPTQHSSERWADAAIQRICAYAHRDTPFFGYVAFHAPHDPRQAPRDWLDRFDEDQIELPANIMPRHPFDLNDTIRDELLAPFPRTPQAIRLHRKEYFAILGHLDAQIGRLLDTLDELGIADNTIIVYTADHGLSLGEHGLMGKQSLYEHAIRVPLILAGPGVPAGVQVQTPTLMQAIHPTLCELAGVGIAETVDFSSLTLDLYGKPTAQPGAHLLAYADQQRAVRTPTHKLIVYPQHAKTELFDLLRDPLELHNLATDPAHATLRRELESQLVALTKAYEDPFAITP